MPAGLCLALLTPIGQVADEPAHIARAAGLLHGQIMGQRRMLFNPVIGGKFPISGTTVNHALIPAALLELFNARNGLELTRRQVMAERALVWSRTREFDGAPNTVQYFPGLYLPGTMGIALTRVAGGLPVQALYAGRIAMLLSYLAIGGLAISLARFGRGLLFALLCLPMALSLGASFNQDGQLIAATALAGALLTLDPQRHRRLRFLALPVLALVLCSKPPYGLLLFAALSPLAASGLLKRLAQVALFAVPVLIWVGLMVHFAQVPFPRPAYHPGPFWPGDPTVIFHATDPAATLKGLLAKPSRFIHLPVAFLKSDAAELPREAVGILGWLTVPLPLWAYQGWWIALASAAVSVLPASGAQGVRWCTADAALVLALVVLSVFALEIAMYLNWDNVGAAAITGLQGRYYLLFIPFLMLAIPRLPAGPGFRQIEAALAVPALAMAVIDIGYLPWLIVHRFYLGP